MGGSLVVQNTIIANHTIGIFRQTGTVAQDYNLFFGNTLNTFGGSITGGTHNKTTNPLFRNPAGDNYRLLPTSGALNGGLNTGVLTDFDGEARPSNAGFDIGYDELLLRRLFLPAVSR